MAAVGPMAALPVPGTAEILQQTHLLDVHAGSSRSDLAHELRRGGYELMDGTPVRFRDWYSTRRPDLTILFLTEVSPRFGLIWGVSTGESGQKYRIDPALHLGIVLRHEPFEGAVISLSLVGLIGGDLNEKPCLADYGAIGGLQRVNCRLAASILPPDETLDYLVDEPGYRESWVSLRFEYRF